MTTNKPQFQVLHILAALGAGGMTASFFFVVNFMTAHPGDVFISWDILVANYLGGTSPHQLLVQFYMLGATLSAILHFVLLARWFKGFNLFRKTAAYQTLKNSNAEVQLMAIPLTLTMSMNVFFILGAMYIPGLFSHINLMGMEAQLIDFMMVGAGVYFSAMLVLALKIFSVYWMRLVDGNLDFVQNSNLAQLLAIFAFGMIGVSLGALSMSKIPTIALFGMSMAYIVITLTIMLGLIKLIIGFKSIFQEGIAPATSVTLLLPMVITAMIVVGLIRADIGAMHALDTTRDANYHLLVTTIGIGFSVIIALFAISVMRRKKYFQLLKEGKLDGSSFALICPGFAFEVQLVMWLNVGMVFTGFIAFDSTVYYVLWTPIIAIQLVTIYYFVKLLRLNHFLKFAPQQANA
ncbi:hypothetical protein J3998_02865 [Thiomicrorhabdus sp. 6S2-11]|jgi:hypothetical protein|uniref:Uncharacterized protein n=1 Tax=Thiomicrorhabdus marina TaxID=2818442 RepID=A0ABS3Q2F7_9GAMM|nr:hypothetical protein [Thiomicrorhabdus marina]MBO1926505.1 hypothetical protein [Thiomicrorhabdus marina]